MSELDRSIELVPGIPVHLQVYINGNKGVAYCNNIVAMNFRAYDIPQGNWGVFVSGGSARFSNMKISTLKKEM
jgi:beta-fructofuranosidase